MVLRSPIFEVPLTGRDEVGDLFAVLLEELWPLTYLDEIPGDPHILHFTGEIKGKTLEGVDLIHLDQEDRVQEITVFFRPFPATAEFLSQSGPKLVPPSRRRRPSRGGEATSSAGRPPRCGYGHDGPGTSARRDSPRPASHQQAIFLLAQLKTPTRAVGARRARLLRSVIFGD